MYVGVTNHLETRVFQHKAKINRGFTHKYNCDRLVYFEEFGSIRAAIHREKQLKKYKRAWKEALIESFNPSWTDLSEGWYHPSEFELYWRQS